MQKFICREYQRSAFAAMEMWTAPRDWDHLKWKYLNSLEAAFKQKRMWDYFALADSSAVFKWKLLEAKGFSPHVQRVLIILLLYYSM